MTNAWPWWEKSKPNVFSACYSWLTFRVVRGQFAIKILIVQHINTTYFIWILKKIELEPAITRKLATCQRITSKNTWPRWVDNWARVKVKWYWSAGSLFWQLSIDQNIDVQCVHYHFCCAPKLAKKYEIEHCSRSSKTINWSADSFQINPVTSMSWHMSPRYGHGILVSGYPVLTAVNWPYCECPI